MRDDQSRPVNHVPAVQNQIEINGPRRAGIRALAAELPLHGQKAVEHRGCGERRLTDGGRIEKRRLPGIDSGRLGFVKGRDTQVCDGGRESVDGAAKLPFTLAEIAAERDRDARRLLQPA